MADAVRPEVGKLVERLRGRRYNPDAVLDPISFSDVSLMRKAADRIEQLETGLRDIVEQTSVGKKGSCVTRSKWGSYPAALWHRARSLLDEVRHG